MSDGRRETGDWGGGDSLEAREHSSRSGRTKEESKEMRRGGGPASGYRAQALIGTGLCDPRRDHVKRDSQYVRPSFQSSRVPRLLRARMLV